MSHRNAPLSVEGRRRTRPIAYVAAETATPAEVVIRIEQLRREQKYSARRIATELAAEGITISVRTVGRHLLHLGLNRRRFLDPTGAANRTPRRIIARWPGHMVYLDVKKTGQIPGGGGWRVHGKSSDQDRQDARSRTRGQRARYTQGLGIVALCPVY